MEKIQIDPKDPKQDQFAEIEKIKRDAFAQASHRARSSHREKSDL